ncbi:hypothetical protein KIN20_028253, partial [Parelaphostrongylus tenuis]
MLGYSDHTSAKEGENAKFLAGHIDMTRFLTTLLITSMLTITAVLGCGVMPPGQGIN